VMVDAQRRHVEANRPARLWFRRSLEEIRTYALGDLAPPDQLGFWERWWAQLLETGFVAGRYQGTKPDGSPIDVFYCALADVLPGRHVVVFAPADWPEDELGVIEADRPDPAASLTPREIEVLKLAAEGTGIRELSEELALSSSTIRTHLKHIYEKLGVHSRTAAVTTAMRLGLIDG
jgi:DNA-binding CsgD family transcriptional regulator